MSVFQASDNKLAMKLFGNRNALMKERLRHRAANTWVIHPCSDFRYVGSNVWLRLITLSAKIVDKCKIIVFVCLFLLYYFTARCIIVQSAVLRLHVVRLSVRLSVCDVGGSGLHRLEILETILPRTNCQLVQHLRSP